VGDLDRLWTYGDVARRWGVSERQVKRRIAGSSLKPMDLGHRTKRFRPADVLRYEAELAGVRERGRFAVN
jgi:hypothetical protein